MATSCTSPPAPIPGAKTRPSYLQRKGWSRGWGENTVGNPGLPRSLWHHHQAPVQMASQWALLPTGPAL